LTIALRQRGKLMGMIRRIAVRVHRSSRALWRGKHFVGLSGLAIAAIAVAGCHGKEPPKVIHRRSAVAERLAQIEPWQTRYERERAVFLQNADVTPRKVPDSFADAHLKQIYQNAYRQGFVQASALQGLQQPNAGGFDPASLADNDARAEWFGWNAGSQAGLAAALDWFRGALEAYEQATHSASQDPSP
jgi:hypothetical protein